MNDIPLSSLLGCLALLLLLSAFFSGSETALLTLNRYRLQYLSKQKHRGALKTLRLLKRPERLFGLILLCNNIVNILAASIGILIALRFGDDRYIIVAIAAVTIALLIVSEVTPKKYGSLRPDRLAYFSSWIYAPLLKLFYPIVWFVDSIANGLLRIFGISAKQPIEDSINKDELKSLVSDNHSMPARYQTMLMSILDLESTSVEDIMTHRKDIVGIDIEEPLENIIKDLQHSSHTRLPVYKKNIDRVIGILHIRDVLSQLTKPDFDKQVITDHLIKPFFIPANTSIYRQMQVFKSEKQRIGLVVDEYGDVQGLVTNDDFLQEIVGEFISEEADIKQQKDGSYLVDASVTVREFNRMTHWELPTEGPKTLNGLIVEYMETIPEPGTSIKLHGYALEILKCDENTVRLVKFHPQH